MFNVLGEDELALRVVLFFLVLLRLGVFVSFTPGIFSSMVPLRVRGAVIVLLSYSVSSLLPKIDLSIRDQELPLLFLNEALIGLIFGLFLRVVTLALNTAGSISSQSTSLMQIFGAANMDPLPALGYLLVLGGLCLSVVLDFHLVLIEALSKSYVFLPIGSFVDSSSKIDDFLWAVTYSFAFAFAAASPFILVSIVYNTLIGFINRAMPQLMVAFVGAPVITLLGLFVLAQCAPFIIQSWFSMLTNVMAGAFNGQ